MLTIFSIPKSFSGHIGVIQKNAINSWKNLGSGVEIILMGNDEGVDKIAQICNVKHIPDVQRNEHGTPLLSYAFEYAQKVAVNKNLMYCNTDILLFSDVIKTLKVITLEKYLLCGRRWDLDQTEEINFSDPQELMLLNSNLQKRGKLHGMSGIDYFIFPKNLIKMPPFAVGRPGWDSWLIFDMLQRNITVIDATESIKIIHQNHNYSHSSFGGKYRVEGPEFLKNLELAGGYSCLATLTNANRIVDRDYLVKKPPVFRYFFSILLKYSLFRILLSTKRYLQDSRSHWH
ncbi:MAG: hypothetical protein HQM10_01040 [Candidatus Riflebacteria bacterium]|nr:hypothetical protein [Candidatus Riflebacteria bacterium]